MTEPTKQELAEAVFKGLGGEKSTKTRANSKEKITAWKLIIPGKYHDKYKLKFYSQDSLNDFIYAWPYPNILGLIIKKARELGWKEYFEDSRYMFVKHPNPRPFKSGLTGCIKLTDSYSPQNDNPMEAICKAFYEVLAKEGKL